MKKAIVLSLPHQGTHFVCKALQAWQIPFEFAHFQPEWRDIIKGRLDAFDKKKEFIVIPQRPWLDTFNTFVDRAVDPNWVSHCVDTYRDLERRISELGYVSLPIIKSPHRFAYMRLTLAAAQKEYYDVPHSGRYFTLLWEPEKGQKNELHKFTLKEKRDES